MTEYTNVKRNLQKLGFRVTRRFGEKDIILEGCGYSIRVAATGDEDIVYAALTADGQPVSWHAASRRCKNPGKWLGTTYRIEQIPEDDLTGSEHDIWQVMRYGSHAGHCITDLSVDLI